MILVLVLFSLFIVSCSGNMDTTNYLAERDSIKILSERQQKELYELDSVMSIVALSLDSIVQTEANLYYSQEGRRLSRHDMLNNLDNFMELINRRRKQIIALQDSLQNRGDNVQNLTKIITYLNIELAHKDQEIKDLKIKVAQKDHIISSLKANVLALENDFEDLEEKTKTIEEVLAVQNEMLNEGYVKIATQKELKKLGLLMGGGLFSKQRFDQSKIRKEEFMKVDMRDFLELLVDSKKVKILTPMPNNSYSLNVVNDKTVLKITDSALFWSVSDFLVIQIN